MASDRFPQPCEPVPLGEFLLQNNRFCAVYFLYHRGEVVYVGQSRTLKHRIDEHLTAGAKVFDEVAFIKCPFNHLSKIENHYIRFLAPKYNQCGLSKKVRLREAWRAEERRKPYGRSKFDTPITGDTQLVDARECHIDERDLGQFFGVSDKDAAVWVKEGMITGTSVVDLLLFAGRNSREFRFAQEKFDSL